MHAKDSPVYTPKDKDLWMLAKLSVQGADLGYNQVAEHLAKTHLLMEPFCVSKDRQLSERHPLHQLIKYHCRGISITDKLAFQLLLAENASLHRLFPYGYLGAVSIALRQFRLTTWKDTDFLNNIKVMCIRFSFLYYRYTLLFVIDTTIIIFLLSNVDWSADLFIISLTETTAICCTGPSKKRLRIMSCSTLRDICNHKVLFRN